MNRHSFGSVGAHTQPSAYVRAGGTASDKANVQGV